MASTRFITERRVDENGTQMSRYDDLRKMREAKAAKPPKQRPDSVTKNPPFVIRQFPSRHQQFPSRPSAVAVAPRPARL